MNSMTLKKVTKGEQSRTHESSKSVGAHLSLGHSCDQFQSSLVIIFSIIEFVLSKSFQQYIWYCYRNFDKLLKFFFSSSLFIKSCIAILLLERVILFKLCYFIKKKIIMLKSQKNSSWHGHNWKWKISF
jgi:hypothetical protein